MGTFSVPARGAVSLRNETSFEPQAAGAWRGTIESVEERPLPSTNDGKPFAGYTSTDGERLAIVIGGQVPQEGQKDVGGRKRFIDIVLRDDIHTYDNTDPMEQGADWWQLQRSMRLVMNLAIALGAASKVGDSYTLNDTFIEDLKAGNFNGMPVGYTVYHRQGKKKDADGIPQPTIFDEIEGFYEV